MSAGTGVVRRGWIASPVVWYLIIGGAKTATSAVLYVVLVLVAVPPQVALAVASVTGGLLGYWGHARLAFGERGWHRLLGYTAVSVGVWGLNAVLLAVLLWSGLGPLLAQVLCLVVATPVGYVALRMWVFR